MPTYRSITISLVSQFDILNIPEYAPPKTPSDPFSASPVLINPDHSLVSVYIPTYPSSQFWISYSVSPPYPPRALYYFKLFLNGSCITSWGCSEQDEYKGRTMFALFDSGESWLGQPTLERRALCFGVPDESDRKTSSSNFGDVMEIKVYRSKGRRRIRSQVQEFRHPSGVGGKKKVQQDDGAGINLINAGLLPPQHSQQYYKYALLDPLDQPFATFRYYYRSWGQLQSLGVIPRASNLSSVHPRPTTNPATASNRNPPNDKPQPNPPTVTDHDLSTDKHQLSLPTNTNHDPSTENSPKNPPTTTDNSSMENPYTNPTISPPPSVPRAPPSPPKPPRKLPQSPPSRVLRSSLKPHSRSMPPSSNRSIFSTLIRRSPSPPKHSSARHRSQSPTGVSLIYRSGSIGVLRDVVSSAMMRRARGSSEALVGPVSEEARVDGSAQREPGFPLPHDLEAEATTIDPIISAESPDNEGTNADGPRARGHWRRSKNRWERA